MDKTEGKTSRCPCGRYTAKVEPIGIQRWYDGTPYAVLFNCDCKSTRSVLWTHADEELREEAEEKERRRAR